MKNTKTKSGRESNLGEHDAIAKQLATLRKAASASDKRAAEAATKSQAVYTAAIIKAENAYKAARDKATAALTAATAKASKINHDERDAIATKNGPLKRRLEFLNSEIRREFPSMSSGYPISGATTGRMSSSTLPPRGRVMRKQVRTIWESNLPEGQWTTRPGSIWERRRIGDMLEIRRAD